MHNITFNWPQDLQKIGLSKNEINLLEKKITKLILKLQKNIGVEFYQSETKDLTPRRIIVYRNHAIVCLKNIQHLEGGREQKVIKLAYDPINGKILFRKKIFSLNQVRLLQEIKKAKASEKGFSNIIHIEKRKEEYRYFEEQGETTLQAALQKAKVEKKPFEADLNSLIHLQAALSHVHQLVLPNSKFSFWNNKLACYHGDLSFDNIVIENNYYKLIDWGSALELNSIIFTPGLQPPECCQKNLKSKEYNSCFARAKDVWAMGLIIGTLLRGGPAYFKNLSLPLPRFLFILNKIKRTSYGALNQWGIAKLEQSEIDQTLLPIINETNSPIIKTIWEVIHLWLQVDPKKRRVDLVLRDVINSKFKTNF